jgi:hypothetical protein
LELTFLSSKHGVYCVPVGALSVGSLAPGFGAAHVASLAVSGATQFSGDATFGDAPEDRLLFKGAVVRARIEQHPTRTLRCFVW